jgi:hypothetical protein
LKGFSVPNMAAIGKSNNSRAVARFYFEQICKGSRPLSDA